MTTGRGFDEGLIWHDATNFSIASILMIQAIAVNPPLGVLNSFALK
jgi:hypothetical protein